MNNFKKQNSTRYIICLFLVLALLSGCGLQQPASIPAPNKAPTLMPETVTITGWLTIVRNGETHYYLDNEQGQTQLFIDEAVLRSAGGPLAIDRKQVTVTGEFVSQDPPALQVTSIQIISD